MENDKKYLISIVIPICNSPKYFQEIISTTLNQVKGETEIIVVDNSDKENLELDKRHILLFNDERIKHIIINDKKGPEHATNTGIKRTTGKFIMLLYNKEQWKDTNNKNGLFEKFVVKIKGD